MTYSRLKSIVAAPVPSGGPRPRATPMKALSSPTNPAYFNDSYVTSTDNLPKHSTHQVSRTIARARSCSWQIGPSTWRPTLFSVFADPIIGTHLPFHTPEHSRTWVGNRQRLYRHHHGELLPDSEGLVNASCSNHPAPRQPLSGTLNYKQPVSQPFLPTEIASCWTSPSPCGHDRRLRLDFCDHQAGASQGARTRRHAITVRGHFNR